MDGEFLMNVLGIAVAAVLSLLIVAKTDQQLTHILEGHAFRSGRDQHLAKQLFVERKRPVHTIGFGAGVAVLTGTLIWLDHPQSRWLGIAFGIIVMAAAIVGRFKSFRSASRALDNE